MIMPPSGLGGDEKRVRVLCFARIHDRKLFEIIEFYSEDLTILQQLGFEVTYDHRTRTAVRSDAEVVYAWWGASALPVLVVFRALGRKCILTGAVGFRDLGDLRAKRWLRSALILIASKVAHQTLAVSDFELSDLRRFGIRDSVLAYHAVDTDYYVPGPKSDRPTAVTVGQLNISSIRRKGIETSIAATSLVRESIPDFELTVVGLISPDGERWLEEARRRYDFSGIKVVGGVDRDAKRALLQSAWVYLQPSRYEGFGVAAVEAMACGTAPVHSSGGALPEVVGSGGVAVGGECSPERLATTIVDSLSSAGKVDELSRRARTRSLTFQRPARKECLDRAFRSVLGDRNPAGESP